MNGYVLRFYGSLICIVAMFLTTTQTRLFGGNIIPQSTPEAICDLICTLWILVGVVLVAVGHSIERK
jgi:hypothetical protein